MDHFAIAALTKI